MSTETCTCGEIAEAVEIARIREAQTLRLDAEVARLAKELADTTESRDFYARSARHIAAKRNLAEVVICLWDSGDLPADTALRMIRSALDVGDVQTFDALTAATTCANSRTQQDQRKAAEL
ncbi:MAG TPA: hypothetical protein VK698_39595 [Kofleriaceae bacterium]|nr:hypothetical protein [Kofleriaceae bacterium]